MMRIPCASCRESVEIADFLSAAAQPCPHCGRFIIGGGDPQEAQGPAWIPTQPVGSFSRLANFVCGDDPLGLRTFFFGHRVVLSRRELDHLPAVCMRCGEPAEFGVRKSFVDRRASGWSQLTNTPDTLSPLRDAPNQPREPWVTIEIPLCREHSRHFVGQNLLCYLCLVGFFGAALWMAMMPTGALVAVPMAAVSAVLALWYIGSRGIRAGKFFDEYLELFGVSPAFARALAEHRTARLNKDAF
jgi:hypothetical protein